MKKLILLSLILLTMPVFAYPENEADFLYNHGSYNTPVILNTTNGHTYTQGINDRYIRDDKIEIYKHPQTGIVETSNGKSYMQITNPINPNDSYYVRTR